MYVQKRIASAKTLLSSWNDVLCLCCACACAVPVPVVMTPWRLLPGTEALVTMPHVTQSFLFFQVTTSAVPAIVVHANEIQPRFAALIKLDFAADGRLPHELACLKVFEDNSSSPNVLHGVADRLQVPLGRPRICVGLIVHEIVH